jgi:hypothetical protein
MATKPPAGPALIHGELAATDAARLRIMINDLVHLILGLELPPPAAVARLTASLVLPRNSSFAFALASARRCCRVFGGSDDGGLELVRES